jgi:hypothetical protein
LRLGDRPAGVEFPGPPALKEVLRGCERVPRVV